MVEATPIVSESSIAEYFAALDDPRIDRTKRHKLLDIVTIAICGTICGADSWVDMNSSATAKSSGSSPSWSCPTASLPMIPLEMSSPAWTQSSFNIVLWSGSKPWQRLPRARWWPSTARRCGALMTAPWASKPSTWLTCGLRPTAWCWARPRWRKSPMRSPPYPSCCNCWN